MSDLPEGVPESIFYQHPDGRIVELLGYRRQPDLSFGVAPRKKRKRPPGSYRLNKPLLFERDGKLCHYCKKEMIVPSSDGENNNKIGRMLATIEHIVPFALGGPNSIDNLVLACKGCNNGFGSEIMKCLCGFCHAARQKYGRL